MYTYARELQTIGVVLSTTVNSTLMDYTDCFRLICPIQCNIPKFNKIMHIGCVHLIMYSAISLCYT